MGSLQALREESQSGDRLEALKNAGYVDALLINMTQDITNCKDVVLCVFFFAIIAIRLKSILSFLFSE